MVVTDDDAGRTRHGVPFPRQATAPAECTAVKGVTGSMTPSDGDVEKVENPSAGDNSALATDVASCLKPSDWTAEQVIQLQALLDARGHHSTARGDEDEPALRRLLAESAVSAPNWHQSVVFFATSEDPADAGMRRRAPLMFAISALVVLVQSFVATGLYHSSTNPSCVENHQCLSQLGQWCVIKDFDPGCEFCGQQIPLPLQLAPGSDPSCELDSITPWNGHAECPVLNDVRADYFAGYNKTAVAVACAHPAGGRRHGEDEEGYTAQQVVFWCDACYHGPTTHVDTTTESSVLQVSVARMSSVDWAALALASLLVGLTVSAELGDVVISETLLAQVPRVTYGWRIAFGVLNWARRWVFLSSLAGTVPQLVLQQ
eukprot:COSAG02_NODE_6479_length_3547_cov_90.720708_3_plen_373_part_01